MLAHLHVGDTVRVAARREAVKLEKMIVITGYERPAVKIESRLDVTDAQRRLLARWMAER